MLMKPEKKPKKEVDFFCSEAGGHPDHPLIREYIGTSEVVKIAPSLPEEAKKCHGDGVLDKDDVSSIVNKLSAIRDSFAELAAQPYLITGDVERYERKLLDSRKLLNSKTWPDPREFPSIKKIHASAVEDFYRAAKSVYVKHSLAMQIGGQDSFYRLKVKRRKSGTNSIQLRRMGIGNDSNAFYSQDDLKVVRITRNIDTNAIELVA